MFLFFWFLIFVPTHRSRSVCLNQKRTFCRTFQGTFATSSANKRLRDLLMTKRSEGRFFSVPHICSCLQIQNQLAVFDLPETEPFQETQELLLCTHSSTEAQICSLEMTNSDFHLAAAYTISGEIKWVCPKKIWCFRHCDLGDKILGHRGKNLGTVVNT